MPQAFKKQKVADVGDVVVMAESGDVEGIRAWIRAHHFSEDVAQKVNKAMIAAVSRGHVGVVKLLLGDGQASADARDRQVSHVKMFRVKLSRISYSLFLFLFI